MTGQAASLTSGTPVRDSCEMTSTKKKAKKLAKRRARQHRRLDETDFTIPEIRLGRTPTVRHALRTERVLRDAAEATLTTDARAYIASRRAKARQRDAAQVLSAIDQSNTSRTRFERIDDARGAIGPIVTTPDLTHDLEASIETYALLVAAADWVSDNATRD